MKIAARPPIAIVVIITLSCFAVSTSCTFASDAQRDCTMRDDIRKDGDFGDVDDVAATSNDGDTTVDDDDVAVDDDDHLTDVDTDDSTAVSTSTDDDDMSGDDDDDTILTDDDDLTDVPRDTSEMVLVPAGPFDRGVVTVVNSACDIVEGEHKSVFLSSFEIDKTEVTVAAYRRCVKTGACSPAQSMSDPDPAACNFNVTDREDHPINCVDWYQATIYCAWAGKRLPTEAEWEKAARGTDRRVYPWGDDPVTCEHANHNNCVGSTTPVGSYPLGASPYGALDMAGNSWEWVQDWLSIEYYHSSPLENPQGPADRFSDVQELGYFRVFRGGSWYYFAECIRTAARGANYPDSRASIWGFRCARSVDE